MRSIGLLLALCGAVSMTSAASAAVFGFSVSGVSPSTIYIGGTLTTNDTPDANGFYLVTDISATYDFGFPLYLLAPGTFQNNDNLVSGGSQHFTLSGLSYMHDAIKENLYFAGGQYYQQDAGGSTLVTVTVDQRGASPAPEPATWAMMVAGFGALGIALRRSRTRVSYAA